jgi:hypothetical protein
MAGILPVARTPADGGGRALAASGRDRPGENVGMDRRRAEAPPMTVEFDCPDCGWHVVNVTADHVPASSRCLSCQWLADNVAPEHRAPLRAILSPPAPPEAPG